MAKKPNSGKANSPRPRVRNSAGKKMQTQRAKHSLPPELTFHFIKNPQHREIVADGATGGILPGGKIQMSIFNERLAIPQQVVHKIEKDARLGAEVIEKRVSRDGIIRNVDITLIMDHEKAKSLYHWLGKQIERLESMLEETKKGEKS